MSAQVTPNAPSSIAVSTSNFILSNCVAVGGLLSSPITYCRTAAPPVGPMGPVGPCGTVKLKTGAPLGPLELTAADVPGAPVVVVPTLIVAAAPVGPVAPSSASKLQFALLPGVPVFPM